MLTIESFTPSHSQGVADLIVPIQRDEYSIAITYEDQPDLCDIPGFYQTGSGGFWVAEDGGSLVGSIGLKDIGEDAVALRKMFVAPSHRGGAKGVAKALLDRVFAHAKDQGVTDIYLGTTAQFLAAHRFYEKHGFSPIDASTLPAAFPRMAVDTRFYHLVLA